LRVKLDNVKQVGLDLLGSLRALGGVNIDANGKAVRDPSHALSALWRLYDAKLSKFVDEFNDLEHKLIDKEVDGIFGSSPAFVPNVIPAQVGLCPEFTWLYHVDSSHPAFDPGPTKGDPTQLPFSVDTETQARAPKWMLGRGGLTLGGVPRIRAISACIESVEETTAMRTCHGGTFGGGNMAAGFAVIRITLDLMQSGFNQPIIPTP
jgi:hypothetical protein